MSVHLDPFALPEGDPLPTAVAEHVYAQSEGLATALEGTESYLGPVLERTLFPRGAPPAVRIADLGPALARWLRGAVSGLAGPGSAASLERIEHQLEGDDGIDALVFPHGAPSRLDLASLLRATRAAAVRENLALRAVIDAVPIGGTLMPMPGDAIVEQTQRVVRLWRVACTWHAIAARHVDARAASLLDGLVTQWRSIERAMDKAFVAPSVAA